MKILNSLQKSWVSLCSERCLCLAIALTDPVLPSGCLKAFFPNCPTLILPVPSTPSPRLNWPTSLVLATLTYSLRSSWRFTQAQFFVWSSRQNRQRKAFQTVWHRPKDAEDKVLSSATHPRIRTESHTHSSTHTHTHTHIYIYIYMNVPYFTTTIKLWKQTKLETKVISQIDLYLCGYSF